MKIFLISILIAGALLRLDRLGERSFWFDEIAELRHADQFIAEKSLIAGGEGGGRLVTRGYYVFLYLIRLCMGDVNEFTARIPAVFFGILTIFLIYIVSKNLFGVIEGIISSFLLSISTYHIAYSQEARPYSMLCFFSILTFYFFYRALKDNSIIWWVSFFIAILINIYTHYAAFYVLGAEVVFGILWVLINFKNYKKILGKYGLILLGLFVLSIFLLKPVIIKGINYILKPGLLNRHIDDLSFNLGFFYRVFGDFTCLSMPFGYRKFLFIIYIFFLLWGIVDNFRRYRMEIIGLILWLTVPFFMVFTIFKPLFFFNPRYFIFLLPALIILVSRGMVVFSEFLSIFFRRKNEGYTLLLLVTLIGIIHIPHLCIYHYSEKDDWQGTAEFLNKSAKAGDIILLDSHESIPALLYYLSADVRNQVSLMLDFKRITKKSKIIWYVAYVDDSFAGKEGYEEFRSKLGLMNLRKFKSITIYKFKFLDMLKEGDIGPIRFEAEDSPSFIGRKARDKFAENGFAKVSLLNREGKNANLLVYGPWLELPEGDYVVKFRMKISDNNIEKPCVKIDVNNPNKQEPLVVEEVIIGREFNKLKEYQDFYLEFHHDSEGKLEFRVHFLGETDLWVDYIEVALKKRGPECPI